jgi:uncharacterized OB-fold protein
VFTWTVTHRAVDPAFADMVPYAIVVAELDEGPRLVGNLRDLDPTDLALGLPIEVELEPVSAEVALVWFRPRAR